MSKLVMTNANVTLGGTDISAYVASVTLSISVNEVETTSFGVGAVQRVGGLQTIPSRSIFTRIIRQSKVSYTR